MKLDKLKNRKGVTLVEVMIALVVLLLVMMGLLQAALLSIDNNTRNILRDEAINIAATRMNEIKNLSFDDATLNDTGGIFTADGNETRNFRSFSRTFTRMIRIDDLDPPNANTKNVRVMVGWNYKNENATQAPTGMEFQHSLTTLMRRPGS